MRGTWTHAARCQAPESCSAARDGTRGRERDKGGSSYAAALSGVADWELERALWGQLVLRCKDSFGDEDRVDHVDDAVLGEHVRHRHVGLVDLRAVAQIDRHALAIEQRRYITCD